MTASHTHARRPTHSHADTLRHRCVLGWPSSSSHMHAHLLLYWPAFSVCPLGTWPSPGPWPDTPHSPQGPAPLGRVQVPGLVTSEDGRRGAPPAGRLERQRVSQQAADRQQRPLLAGGLLAHLAEQRQWWPAPPAQPPSRRQSPRSLSVRNLPQSPAGRQPEGSTRGLPREGSKAPCELAGGQRVQEGEGPRRDPGAPPRE